MRTHQLVAVEPQTGRVWTLFPVAADAPSEPSFEAHAGWLKRESPSINLLFKSTDGDVTGLVVRADGATTRGRRIRFRERDVVVQNGEITLSGTLILPDGPGPHPAMVIVHGSGPLTRRAPRYMGHLLAHRGVAALVYDKRGTGRSTGQWQAASYADLADDVAAVLSHLLREPDIDRTRVGLFGSSEAGYIIPAVAVRDPRVSLLVCRVCPALPQRLVAPVQQRSSLLREGFTPAEVEDAVSFHLRLVDYAVERTGYSSLEDSFARLRERPWMSRYGFTRVPPPDAPYWDRFGAGLTLNPIASYDKLRMPILIVLGELDDRIAVEPHREAFVDSARRSGNRHFTVQVMPRASHGLLEVRRDDSGRELPSQRFAPEFHEVVLDWVARHARGDRRERER